MCKFKLLFTVFLLPILLGSCSEENLEIGDNDVNKEVKQILELQLPEQRTAYVMSSPEIKYFIWKQVLLKKLVEEDFNKLEIKKLEELLAILSPKLFESPEEAVHNKELIKWKDEAIQIFGREKFILHFTKLNAPTNQLMTTNQLTSKQLTMARMTVSAIPQKIIVVQGLIAKVRIV